MAYNNRGRVRLYGRTCQSQLIKSLVPLTLLFVLLYSYQSNHIVHSQLLHTKTAGQPVLADSLSSVGYKQHTVLAGAVVGAEAEVPANNSKTTKETDQNGQNDSDRLKQFEEFKKSKLFLPPFEEHIKYLPDEQVQFVRKSAGEDLALFKKIVNEAVDTRNNWAPSARLMLKYSAKLIATFLRNRAAEQKIKNRYEPSKAFFIMLADLVDAVVSRSAELKKERGYKKANIDAELFRRNVMATFDYCHKIVCSSPLAGYHKWNELRLFNDDPANPKYQANFIEEAANLFAQFRAMGYESSSFVAKRIVNMLRLFGRGVVIRSEKEI